MDSPLRPAAIPRLAAAISLPVLAVVLISVGRVRDRAPGSPLTVVLCRAARTGRLNTVRALVSVAPGLANSRDMWYCRLTGRDDVLTPLHWAAGQGHTGVVDILVAEGADVRAVCAHGLTPLHWAANTTWYPDVVQRLVAAGADPNARDGLGYAPLHYATKNNGESLMVVRSLVDAGADVNATDGRLRTPLHLAAHRGEQATVRILIDHGADVGAKDRYGQTALHVASKAGHLGVVELLLSVGADSGAMDHRGRTPKSVAAGPRRKDIADRLTAAARAAGGKP